jgi:tryptophanyl-tRNA synthetase
MQPHESREPQRIVTGLRATGRLHLGNHFGAVRPFIDLLRSDRTNGFFCIADLHTLTTLRDPEQLRALVPAIVLDVLAAGVDPARAIVFTQSSVPETSELAWLFASLTYVGELERVPSFKERERHRDSGDPINMGMLNYPLLMAADILGPRAHRVSVGEDQYAHLELARDIARRFNRTCARDGESFFPEPEALAAAPVRIPGLDGSGKMGKSVHNAINFGDDADARWAKLAPAVTDPARRTRQDPGTPENCPIYSLHQYVSTEATCRDVASGCRGAAIGCVDCKQILHRGIGELIDPMRLRRAEIAARPEHVREVLADGAARARAVVRETRDVVQERVGIVRYGSEVAR